MGYEQTEPDLDPHGARPFFSSLQVFILATICITTLVVCGTILAVRFLKPELLGVQPTVRNEQEVLDEVDRLQAEGLAAYEAWAKARDEGDSDTEERMHREALAKFRAALDTLERLMDRYRDANGYVRPEYAGYETQMTRIAVRISDLTKDSRVRLGD